MKACDVMTRDVAIVTEDTLVHDIAARMMTKRISGIPVGGNGRVIVSQCVLLHRAEVGTERGHKWWFRVFTESDAAAREYANAHGLRAQNISHAMSQSCGMVRN